VKESTHHARDTATPGIDVSAHRVNAEKVDAGLPRYHLGASVAAQLKQEKCAAWNSSIIKRIV